MAIIPWDGVVLCGGRSSRMGRDKALIVVDGRPMAVNVAQALRKAGADSIRAVGGDLPALRAAGLDGDPDRWPGEGPLGALVQALDDAPPGSDAVAVLSCDLLRPSSAAIASMIETLAETGADAVVPRLDDRAQWLHGVWRTRVGTLLGDVFAAGERSIHGAVQGLDIRFVLDVDPGVLADADVPGDLP